MLRWMKSGLSAALLGVGAALLAAPQTTHWETLAPMPIGVQEIYPAAHRGRIVVAGGLSSELPAAAGHLTNALQIYEPMHDRWSLGPALPEGRHHGQLLSLGDTLYLIGGFVRCAQGDWCASRDLLALKDGSTQWQRLAELPEAVTETGAFVLAGELHLVSGRSPRGVANGQWGDHGDVDGHWVFNPERGSWRRLSPGPERKSSAATALFQGSPYLVGGRRYNGANLSSVHRLDPASGRWLPQAPLAFAQAAHGLGLLGDRLCSVGGEFAEQGGGVLSQVQCLDATEGRWRIVTEMPEPRHGLGVVSLDGRLYVLGGARKPGLNQTSARVDRLSLSTGRP
ncbi:MAG: galactose oxidase [Burkholderiaceae bacterium]|nr:galactose oxidase [Burkholderiaceae bacterium]